MLMLALLLETPVPVKTSRHSVVVLKIPFVLKVLFHPVKPLTVRPLFFELAPNVMMRMIDPPIAPLNECALTTPIALVQPFWTKAVSARPLRGALPANVTVARTCSASASVFMRLPAC
ncbi:unnamed protein product [Prorocentrum cordatum]|uniref:Secreted protein n=1 Tax=Prorocentrum cordatum TaxID=2364126 RepID=A0ABN9VEI6_9DINO|nr:unnamed protein product [Polarella glacialis]